MLRILLRSRRLRLLGIVLAGLIIGALLLFLFRPTSLLSRSRTSRITLGVSATYGTPGIAATHRATEPARTPTVVQSPQPSPVTRISYHTSGKRILDNLNRPYVPYGVFLGGILLANENWRQNGATTYITQAAVQAAHDYWFANVVSLQVAYEPLFPHGSEGQIGGDYLALIDNVVHWANALGMNVSIVLQEEAIYGSRGQPVILPTRDAMTFWDFMSRHYARNQRVFFDLFNEPDLTYLTEPDGTDANSCPAGSGKQQITWDDACAWSYWKNGTTQAGITYYGMNQIAHKIRENGAQNLIFAQGLAAGEDLALLVNTYTAEHGREFLLTVPDVVYAVHPYFGPSHDTEDQWDQWFGTAAANSNFPVLASEWNLNQEAGSGCEANSKVQIPQISVFLNYLWFKNIGLVGWALQTGELIRGWNFRDPTTFTSPVMPANCDVPPFSTSPQAQGAGQLLQRYFVNHSSQM